MYRYFLALKFLVSRPINLLGVLGVMLGVWSLIVVVSIFDGYSVELSKQFTMASSDMTVIRLGPRADFDRIREIVESDPNVVACSPRLIWRGMIHPRDEVELRAWLPGEIHDNGRFTQVTGIDPTLENKTVNLEEWFRNAPPDLRAQVDDLVPGDNWILVSERKAESKNYRRDDDLTVTSARVHHHRGGTSTQLLAETFRVAGTFRTHHAGFDNLTVLVSIQKLRSLIAGTAPGFANEVAIKLAVTEKVAAKETGARLAAALRAIPDYRIHSPMVLLAGEQEDTMMKSIAHQGGLMKLVLFVIMVIAAFLVYATLSMMVTEKTHDIGVLTALGGTRTGVMQIFLTSGVVISLVGTILGVITGCGTAVYLNDFNELLKAWFDIDLFPADVYNLPGVPYHLDPIWIGLVAGITQALGVVASLLPAFRSLRKDPLACLRNE